LAAEMNAPLLIIEMEQAILSAKDFDSTLKLIFREARLRQALLYLKNFDTLLEEERATSYGRFLKIANEDRGAIVLASEKPPAARCEYSLKTYQVHFPGQDFGQRRACWDENLRRHGVTLSAKELDALAAGFRLTGGEISVAIAAAVDLARLRSAALASPETLTHDARPQPTAADLFASARARLSHNLSSFARKIEPKYAWEDIVLPVDQINQLREICNQYKYQQVVYGEWGFGRKLSLGRGLNVLFSGHPGTGKTMAAEVIAGELQIDLYKIDLSQVVSKYIGETEKSLNRIFSEAQAGSSILFFDEADALFGKRTEVKDSHDRYANIEVSYLLQKMEEYDGIAILATNLRQNMDEAFLRRMQFIVELPFPDEESRRRIWEVLFPREAPVASDVDFTLLAREVRLAGGNLKNIGLAAAFYAASDGRVIRQQHLVRAVRREFQKMGRSWSERDWKLEESSIPRDDTESERPS
jgi:SpoVK/Ycf46/Vps4 family AAA+-type ATPase